MKLSNVLATLSFLSIGVVACGGQPKPASAPDANLAAAEGSTKEDMPAPKDGDGAGQTATAAEAPKAGPAAASGVIKVSAMKVASLKKEKGKSPVLELKDDGTVVIDGKTAAKISGDQVDSAGGTSMLTVGVDGSLVGNAVQPGLKFEGDDLVSDKGAKYSVGDDGTVSVTKKDGKSEPIAKADGGAAAKRAALVLTVLYLNAQPEAAAAPKATKK
jgi:hypothetical protein